MTVLRTKFPSLVANKEVVENRRIPNTEIAVALRISESTVSRWRSGKISSLSHDMLLRMCEYFRCEVGELLYIEWDNEGQQQTA